MTDPLLDYEMTYRSISIPLISQPTNPGIPESIIYTPSIQANQDRMCLYRQ